MKLYDSLSREKRDFVPIAGARGPISIYACGITPHDHAHLGHALASIRFHMIRSYLEFSGFEVTFVQNVTDVDDKIITRAERDRLSPREISERFTNEYNQALRAFGVRRQTHEPKVSEYIPQIIVYVQELIDRGYAYAAADGVYFDIAKKSDYGKLSGRRTDDLIAGTREEVRDQKRSALDFALWKCDEFPGASWDSPWGKGRPGWHIECSVMCNALLGKHIDIHCGGVDLLFPHHENELAQCEAHNDCPYVNYWVYSGLLNINGEKMSKSLGNFITMDDALARYGAELVTYVAMKYHYRSPINFSDQVLDENLNHLLDFYSAFSAAGVNNVTAADAVGDVRGHFTVAMDNDFNTPVALVGLSEALKEAEKLLNKPAAREQGIALVKEIRALGQVLGLFRNEYTLERFASEALRFKAQLHGSAPISIADISQLLKERQEARGGRDFARSDAIRDKLASLGIGVLDSAQGSTTWRFLTQH